MSNTYRARNAPLINPFDQLPTPAFDAFVNDISGAIRAALHPQTTKSTWWTKSSPANRDASARERSLEPTSSHNSPADTLRYTNASTESSLRAFPRDPKISVTPSDNDHDDNAPLLNGGDARSASLARDRPDIVDLTSIASGSDGEDVEATNGTEGASQDRYYVPSSDEGEDAAGSSVDSSDEVSDDSFVNDTFDMYGQQTLSLMKGKGRAADEGPGVHALRGISERMHPLPQEPVYVDDDDDAEYKQQELSASWGSEADEDAPDAVQDSESDAFSGEDGLNGSDGPKDGLDYDEDDVVETDSSDDVPRAIESTPQVWNQQLYDNEIASPALSIVAREDYEDASEHGNPGSLEPEREKYLDNTALHASLMPNPQSPNLLEAGVNDQSYAFFSDEDMEGVQQSSDVPFEATAWAVSDVTQGERSTFILVDFTYTYCAQDIVSLTALDNMLTEDEYVEDDIINAGT